MKQISTLKCLLVFCLSMSSFLSFGQTNCNLTAQITESNPLSCTQPSATLTVQAAGEPAPHSYMWSDSTTANSITVSQGGNYMVTVTAANGCTTVAEYQVAPAMDISVEFNVSPVSCANSNDGSAAATVLGGVPPYSYLWSNGATTATATNLSAAFYNLTVTDANGCTLVSGVNIFSTLPITIGGVTQPASCSANSGSIVTTTTGGSSMLYTWLWSNGSTANHISNLAAGTYTVTATDANGCTGSSSFVVEQNGELAVVATGIAANCLTGVGSALTSVSGITGTAAYLWSNGDTTQDLTDVPMGTYTVTVSDMVNGNIACTGTGIAVIDLIYNQNSVTYLPDGNGVTYESPLPVAGFLPGQVVLSGDFGVYLNMEHSFLGDLQITLTCPNGQTSTLKGFPGGGGTNLGEPIFDNLDVPGVGYTYQFSDNATQTIVQAAANNTTTLPEGIYRPETPFSSFVGCPLNGTWVISVTDNMSIDNGYLFAWGLVLQSTTCSSNITGTVVAETTNNLCILDATDTPITNFLMKCTDNATGIATYAFTDTLGVYNFSVPLGDYTVTPVVQDCEGFALGCPNSLHYLVAVDSVGLTYENNDFFGINTAMPNLGVYVSQTPCRPGFTQTYYIHYNNNSATAANNVVLTFTHSDSLVNFMPLSSADAPNTYDAATQTATWNLGTLASHATGQFTVILDVPIPLTLGQQLSSLTTINADETESCNEDNSVENVFTVTNAVDPNAVTLTSRHSLANEVRWEDTPLRYLIQFQNEGTDTAFIVTIKNQLDLAHLNIETFRMLGASHEYAVEYVAPDQLVFRFPNIILPHAAVNEPASHGWVLYEIKLKPNTPFGTTVENQAGIIFNFNQPVMTNISEATLVQEYLVSTQNAYSEQLNLSVLPNPITTDMTIRFNLTNSQAVNIMLSDAQGKTVGNIHQNCSAGAQNISFPANDLPKGVYFLTVQTTAGNAVYKVVKL